MVRVRLALGAGVLLTAATLAVFFARRSTSPRASVSPTEQRGSAAPRAVPSPAGAVGAGLPQLREPPAASGETRVTHRAPPARRANDSASRTDVDLVALEDQALRRIDVTPLLEAAGIDVVALRARPDVDDVLRHVAGDELLTRGRMRDLFATTVYPYGYPRDDALRDARVAAEGMVSGLTPEARAESLAAELEAGARDLPDPVVYPLESGRVFEGRPQDESAAP